MRDRNRGISSESFTYYRCTECALITLNPVPDDLSQFYSQDYYPLPASLSELQQSAKNEQFKLDLVRAHVREGRMLEVGPASGNFAYLAKQSGFEVEAVEMDPTCCDFLREVAGINAIQHDDIIEAIAGKQSYDIIALWHVIEHLSNFISVLDYLATKVKPKGHIVIASPNPDSLQFSLLGKYWAHIDAPRHLALIPMAVLESRLEAHGFIPVSRTTNDPGGLGWNEFGWRVSFANFSRSLLSKPALEFAGSVATRLMRPFERNNYRGSAYTVVLQNGRQS